MLTLNTDLVTMEILIENLFKIKGVKRFSSYVTNGLDFALTVHIKIGTKIFS